MSLFAVAGNSTHLFIISEILKVRSPGAGRTRSSIGGWGKRSQGHHLRLLPVQVDLAELSGLQL